LGDGPAPTGAETEAKVSTLLSDAERNKGTSPANQPLSSPQALSHLRVRAGAFRAQSLDELQARITVLSAQRQTAETAAADLAQAQATQGALSHEIEALKKQREDVLAGETSETLVSRVTDLERSLTTNGAIADLAAQAKKLCIEYSWSTCPACGTEHGLRRR